MGRHPNIILCIESIPQQEVCGKVNQFLEFTSDLTIGLINDTSVIIDDDISNEKEYKGISKEEALYKIKNTIREKTLCKSLHSFTTLGGLKGLEDIGLNQVACYASITWQPPFKRLTLNFMLDCGSMFQVYDSDDEKRKRVYKRCNWIISVADSIWDKIKPNILIADFEVQQAIYFQEEKYSWMPWLIYTDTKERFQKILIKLHGNESKKLSELPFDKIYSFLKRSAFFTELKDNNSLKVIFNGAISEGKNYSNFLSEFMSKNGKENEEDSRFII